MKQPELTTSQEQCLRNQVISPDQPGTVLRDFGMLLDYVGPEGVEAQGKYNLLPMKLIDELDRRLSRPLHLNLKRPQIRSHPYLQGLNLLLRASGLTCIKGTGAKARLVVDPEMMVQWEQLNPTEQYFNLLEAWLRFGRPEMVGERGSLWDDLRAKCLQGWNNIPERGRRFNLKKPQDIYLLGIGREFYLLALMDLFGLVEVEIPTRPITPWCPAAIRHLPFGDALFTLLTDDWQEAILGRFPALEHDDQEDEEEEDGEFNDQEDEEEEDGEFNDQEDEEEEDGEFDDQVDGSLEPPRFGLWQPIFQPYFPSWQKNLILSEPETREGTFVFLVSLGEIWRLIAMPSHKTLNDLVYVILRSVKFDDEHLHEFTFRDRMGAMVRVSHPATDEPPYTDEVRIGRLPLEPGQTMELTYDFGDEWLFTVKLERIEPPDSKRKAPRILESHGKAPQQYDNWDD